MKMTCETLCESDYIIPTTTMEKKNYQACIYTYLHENGIPFWNTNKHVSSHMLHTCTYTNHNK